MCNPENMEGNRPPNPHDERPLVKDLLEKHKASIEDVRQRIKSDETVGKPLWDPERYDDIWILRYILSHKGDKNSAAKAALKTMKIRDEMNMNELGDIRHRIKNYGVENEDTIESLPGFDLYNKYACKNGIIISQPDPDRGVLVFLDISDWDFDGMMAGMSNEQVKEHSLYLNEAVYQILDEVTRRTGKLTKLTRILDLGTFSFFKINYKFSRRDAAIQKQIEDYHPQLLEKIYIFNPPSWFNAVWQVMRPFFPKRFAEKLDVAYSSKLHTPLLKQVSEANLPERLGGKNKEWPLPSIAVTMATAAANE